MIDYVGRKMIVDTLRADGGVYFEKDYLEWRPRKYVLKDLSFRIFYRDITDVQVTYTFKKRVDIICGNKTYSLFTHRINTFMQLLDSARAGSPSNVIDAEVITERKGISPEDLERLMKLAELKGSGALTEEEFNKQKEQILRKYQ